MRYALIREMDISNGEGVGVSLFVQGCHRHCKGCFNPETWDFNGGKEWTEETLNRLLELLSRPYVIRLSILGGEPLADENAEEVLHILEVVRQRLPAIKIWVYTGYDYEDVIYDIGNPRRGVLWQADILVDGAFELENQDALHTEIKWAGSTNQRVIDVQRSLITGRVCLYNSPYMRN